MTKSHADRFWFVFRRDRSDSSIWVGHCIDLDIVSYGPSLHEAFQATCEAVDILVCDDLENGRKPRDRQPAPFEVQQDFQQKVLLGEPTDMAVAMEHDDAIEWLLAAVNMLFRVESSCASREEPQHMLWASRGGSDTVGRATSA